MGNPLWTRIEFGGKIKRSDLSSVADLMQDSDGNWPKLKGKNKFEQALNEIETAAKERRPVLGYIGDSNNGGGSGLPERLRQLGLTYCHHVENLGSEGGGIEIWNPELIEPQRCGHLDYEPAITHAALCRAFDDRESLADVINQLAPFARKPPALEIARG